MNFIKVPFCPILMGEIFLMPYFSFPSSRELSSQNRKIRKLLQLLDKKNKNNVTIKTKKKKTRSKSQGQVSKVSSCPL